MRSCLRRSGVLHHVPGRYRHRRRKVVRLRLADGSHPALFWQLVAIASPARRKAGLILSGRQGETIARLVPGSSGTAHPSETPLGSCRRPILAPVLAHPVEGTHAAPPKLPAQTPRHPVEARALALVQFLDRRAQHGAAHPERSRNRPLIRFRTRGCISRIRQRQFPEASVEGPPEMHPNSRPSGSRQWTPEENRNSVIGRIPELRLKAILYTTCWVERSRPNMNLRAGKPRGCHIGETVTQNRRRKTDD